MPWCPRCDEIFPEGPACPRCSTRLVDRDRGGLPEELQAVPELPMIKVSRRDRRALERLSGPKAPSSRVLAAAVAALVFAVGFLLGRLGSIEPAGPSVRALPAAEALTPPFEVDGKAVYLLWTEEPLATIAVHTLSSGDVVPRARFSAPFDPTYDARTNIATLGTSVALVVAQGKRSFVAFAPTDAIAYGWVPGVEAAWKSPEHLLIREASGDVFEWSVRTGDIRERPWGRADRLFQAPDGAVVERSGRLEPAGFEADDLPLQPSGRGRVIATDGTRALIDGDQLALWDGDAPRPVRAQGHRAVAAAFEPDGERVGVVLQRGDELTVAVVDERGNAALKPLGGRGGKCAPAIAWDWAGSWIYVAPGDGALYALEASGGFVELVRTHSVGCGLAWIF